ncbi:heterokaryon incompatibility protein-domain-containing protein [Podospora aff. communis PSN243]|uniref:Heterokaryon incompatibility protein-domain-containing protein n=1 Tax=Podospora aff. communis PSN243 TaxID=3040156 RepID=A0AAV9GSZ4_9PEZI|nr:heterokaryon incompatibility protein-domain-containing protein [Podospora aff. communis PSN243]
MEGDQVCEHCAKVPLFSLFGGPRRYEEDDDDAIPRAPLGTLKQIWENTQCPLCRLVKTVAAGSYDNLAAITDTANILVTLRPESPDWGNEMSFEDERTKRMMGSRLTVQFSGLPGADDSEAITVEVRRWAPPAGIQLLSPESVVPERPLNNGYRATTMEESLRLLGTWIQGCEEHHGETCRRGVEITEGEERILPRQIRAIDVANQTLVEIDPAVAQYATLSYVWGTDSAAYAAMAAGIDADKDEDGDGVTSLPATVPKIIDDAMSVCRMLSIPYLWVDLYCIDQVDLTRKAAEISVMGHIYRSSYVTLIAGRKTRDLLPVDLGADLGAGQRIETVDSKTYITEQTPISLQMWRSDWITRSWTYQEGHLARRVAFFPDDGSDISFLCGAGHWRESLHSGPEHGHSPRLSSINLASGGFHVLGGHKWLATDKWRFPEYERIVLNYGRRKLSFETDKLNALVGCLRLVGERKGVEFLAGLPSADFHYALLWGGEDGPRREGFPSWSWAGWTTSMNTTHIVGPQDGEEVSSRLISDKDGAWVYVHDEDKVQELQGVLMIPTFGQSPGWNRCRQRFADIRVAPPYDTVRIESEVARFVVDFSRDDLGEDAAECDCEVCKVLSEQGIDGLQPDKVYQIPSLDCGLRMRSVKGRDKAWHRFTYRWLSEWPFFKAGLPEEMTGREMTRLLGSEGLELIKVVEIELVEGDERYRPFRHVLCLGVDRGWDEGREGRGSRMGMFVIPGEMWDEAGPESMAVELW